MELESQSREEVRKRPKAITSPFFLVQWQGAPQAYPGDLRIMSESWGALLRRLWSR